jgi:hypothetical protein
MPSVDSPASPVVDRGASGGLSRFLPLAPATRTRAAIGASRAPALLTWALLLLVLYAAYDHGAAGLSAGARIQVLVSALAALVAGAVLLSRTLTFAAPRRAMIALGLLGAFAAWNAITVAWSIAPDQTWIEFNRVLTYVLVLALAITAGASNARAPETIARGFLLVALAVAVYGLGQKLFPGLSIPGLFNLNQTGGFARLQEPFGYWNALALFLAMAVPVALAIAVDRAGSRRRRLLSLLTIELLLLTVGLTYSRGGLLALGFGAAVGIAVSGARLRSLMWFALAVVATLPPLVFGLVNHDLTTANISLSARETAGVELAAVLLVSLLGLGLAGGRLLVAENRARISPERARRIGHLIVLVAGVLLVCGVLAVAFSSRGLTGTVSHAWDSFTATKGTSVSSPDRLLSVASENRWVWWKEALGAFSDRPIGGWGAGSFAAIHLLYRRDTLSVTQAHSGPLQFLAETGLVGTALVLCAFAMLLATATIAARRRPEGTERLFAAALLAGGSMYALHAFYDWDWNIPGVTFPALLFLGVLAGAAGRRERQRSHGHEGDEVLATDFHSGPSLGVRGLALVPSTVTLCIVALSGVLPSLAAGRANDALITAARATSGALVSAQSSARLATSLDPLSDAGLLVEASVAQDRGRPKEARTDLLEALRRDPTDVNAWQQLSVAEGLLHDHPAQAGAAQRMLELDPMNAEARALLQPEQILTAPPQESATAIPTPGG